MIPFALETYGGLGAEAVRLLKRLAKASKEYSPKQFMTHAYNRLSVTLQSSNANVQLECMQQHLLREQQANKSSFDEWRRNHWERTTKYAEPKDSNKLARDIARMMGVAHAHTATTTTTTHAASLESSSSPSSSSQSDTPFVHAVTSGLAGHFTVTIDDDELSVDTDHPNHMHHHRHVSVTTIDDDAIAA
jgi:hypothetical protein